MAAAVEREDTETGDRDVGTKADLLQTSHPPFLEVVCKRSGKVRRFAAGTEARFAVRLINQKLDFETPLASHIESVKEGEEPVSFGPSAVLVNYGEGWRLQTVVEQGYEGSRSSRTKLNHYPHVLQQRDSPSSEEGIIKTNVSLAYIGKALLAFAFMFFLGGVFTFFLENLPQLISFVSALFD